MNTAVKTKSQSDDKTKSGEAIKFEERFAGLDIKIKYNV